MTDDILISYALGHLTPEEEAAVELHLQRTPQDAATVAAYLDMFADLVFALPPEPLPQNGEAVLLARVRGASQTPKLPSVIVLPAPEPALGRRPQRLGVWSLLAAAAVVALLYVGVRVVPTTDPFLVWQLQRYEGQPGATTYALAEAESERPLGTLVRLFERARLRLAGKQPEFGAGLSGVGHRRSSGGDRDVWRAQLFE